MLRFRKYVIFIALIFFTDKYLSADIIITTDDMILNGKIIEEKEDEYIILGNYHGIFTINSELIKEVYRTDKFEDDVRILKEKGESVNSEEVEINYNAGMEKLDKHKEAVKKDSVKMLKENQNEKKQFNFLLLPFLFFNSGKISDVLPYSTGLLFAGEMSPVRYPLKKFTVMPGIRGNIGYFHSQKDNRRIIGFRTSAGPFWRYFFHIREYELFFSISPLIGIGLYYVKNNNNDLYAVKWNMGLHSGLSMNFSPFLLSLAAVFDYINDRNVPVYGFGIAAGAGVQF